MNGIEILTTVIPRGKKDNLARLNVLLSPRLWSDSSNQTSLSQFPNAISKWYESANLAQLNNVTFKFFADNDLVNHISVATATHASPDLQKAKDLWNAMFDPSTPVEPWKLKILPVMQMQTREQITKDLVIAIDACIDAYQDMESENDPYAHITSPQLISDRKNSFILYLEQLKKKTPETLLLDPMLDMALHPWLSPLRNKLIQLKEDYNKILFKVALGLSDEEVKERNETELCEFHKRFSAYSNHPALLKKTGWLWEYTLSEADVNRVTEECKGKNIVVAVEVTPTQSMVFGSCYTGISMDTWRSAPGNIQGTEHELYWLIAGSESRGYIEVKSDPSKKLKYSIEANVIDNHQILQKISDRVNYQLNTAASQNKDEDYGKALKDFLSIQNKADKVNVLSDDALLAAIEYRTGKFGEYHNNGITLSITGLLDLLQTSIKANTPTKQNEKKVFYRNNLIQGYRVDVLAWNGEEGNKSNYLFGSLCKKEEEYHCWSQTEKKWLPLDEAKEEEGWITETVQGTKEGNFYFLDERLVCWNDHSLVCNPEDILLTGKPKDPNVLPDNAACVEKMFSRLEILTHQPCTGTIPLRIGWWYRFAIRPVYIDGSGRPPWKLEDKKVLESIFNDTNTEIDYKKYFTPKCKYERVESVLSPMVLAGTKIYEKGVGDPKADAYENQSWVPNRTGEEETTLVVRSRYERKDNKGVLNHAFSNNTTRRYLAPPKANYDSVWQHGALDKSFSLCRTDEHYEELVAKLREKNDCSPEADELHSYKDGDMALKYMLSINHLYDPLADGFEIAVDGVVRRFYMNYSNYDNFLSDDVSKRHKYFACNLHPNEDNSVKEDLSKTDEYAFYLPAGVEKKAYVSCLLNRAKMEDKTGKSLPFMNGVAKMRHKTLKLVHAVQKPCLLGNYPDGNKFWDIVPVTKCNIRRMGSNTGAVLDAEFKQFPVLTSECYCLYVEYADLICDRSSKTGYVVKYQTKMIKSDIQPDSLERESDVKFLVEHSFDENPGNYRRANYKIEATSRFRKYFEALKEENAFSIYGACPIDFGVKPVVKNRVDNLLAITNKNYDTELKDWRPVTSTIRPDAVEIERIVPLITVDSNTARNAKITCNKIRVYLKGNWYSTGAGEKLAVMFTNSEGFNSSTTVKITANAPTVSLSKVVSQFGADPAAGPTELDHSTFRKMNIMTDADHRFFMTNDFVGNVPLTDLDFDTDGLEGVDLSKIQLSAALYDVQFTEPDAKTKTPGNFYVDIALNNEIDLDDEPHKDPDIGKYYFPFIRFALARYQPQAVRISPKHPGRNDYWGYMFSKIAVTDFCQIFPRRKVSWDDPQNKGRNIRLHRRMARKRNEKNEERTEVYGVYLDSRINDAIDLNHLNLWPDFSKDQIHPFAFIPYDKGQADMFRLHPDDGNIIPGDVESVLVLEYEVYKDYNREPEGNTPNWSGDPTADYTRRLVFSYVVNF